MTLIIRPGKKGKSMSEPTDNSIVDTITLVLAWTLFDPPDKPHHRTWTLKAGLKGVDGRLTVLFNIGEVWYSLAKWSWHIVGREYDLHGSGYETHELAQAALIAVVRDLNNANL